MIAQYLSVKEAHPDALLFYRMGDFYEMFFEDAERVAPLHDLALTSRADLCRRPRSGPTSAT